MRKKKIWLLKLGEVLPIDGEDIRLQRTGMLAKELHKNGFDVTWWTSTVNHVNKEQRFMEDTEVEICEGYRIKLIYSNLYKKNVSLSRIRHYKEVSEKFLKMANRMEKPDLIITCLPIINLSKNAILYKKNNNVPVILDIRDLWPDVFLDLFPNSLKSFARFLLKPLFKDVELICSKATAIVGISPLFVKWAKDKLEQPDHNEFKCFPLGYYSHNILKERDTQNESKLWDQYKLDEKFIICFFGNFGRQFDFNTVIEAAKILHISHPDIRFVLCGNGDNHLKYQQKAQDCPNIIFPGWINASDIRTLMDMSKIGLAPYKNTVNFQLNLPNKPIEYMSAGLPILSSIDGYLKTILQDHNMGVTYEDRNPESLANHVSNLYKNRDLLGEMSKNTREIFKSHYSSEKIYKEYVSYIEGLINNKN
ncbi:glycosyltransferase family 4 protein [Bacillus cereus]|uniref:glycosyltransferase family 4 protein n=1 Tax=Bacillus cereus TaxID=1396 RepID=UPI000C285147|nr:glycosyltransferase family 4 protein [Bacillus cereus]